MLYPSEPSQENSIELKRKIDESLTKLEGLFDLVHDCLFNFIQNKFQRFKPILSII
jgi:hypothetical protein